MRIVLAYLLVFNAFCQLNEENQRTIKAQLSFDQFIVKFEKDYKNEGEGAQEYLKRKAIFEQNVKNMRENPSQTEGINFFTDLTDQEFNEYKGLIPYPQKYIIQGTPTRFSNMKQVGLPYLLNWADRKVVTSVKNQGTCGTCWSFATIAMAESSLILKGYADENIDLSEQYLLDCTLRSTCRGGYLYYAAQAAVQGVPYEDQWPYQEKKSGRSCDSFRQKIKPANTFEFFTNLNDYQLKQLVVAGPVAVAVSSETWKNYVGGYHYCKKNQKIDHAVLLVGYDDRGWILKNQWGSWWGENGYIRVGYGENDCRLGSEVISLSQPIYRYVAILICSFFLLALIV